MKIVGLFLIDSQVIAKHIDFDSHMGKIESQTAMRTRINYALVRCMLYVQPVPDLELATPSLIFTECLFDQQLGK